MLKGRANYVCHHHLERTAREGRLPSREDARALPKIVAFARASERGDRAELADVPENASIWPLVTSTRDNCLGQHCAFHKECFVLKARKDALDADVVVVNHHLFFADVMLRDEGLAELLPACNTVILDEAHQLPDTATLFFGEQTGAGQLAELARDAEIAARTAARDVPALPDAAADLVPAIRKLRLAAGDVPGKFTQQAIAAREGFPAGARRAVRRTRPPRRGDEALRRTQRGPRVDRARAEEAAARIARWRAGLIGAPPEDGVEWIRWIDVTPQGWQLQASPLSIADIFRAPGRVDGARVDLHVGHPRRGQRFHPLHRRNSASTDAATGAWDSPFDYDRQALLYVPRDLPPPNTREHTDAVVDAALPLLKASGGRAFLLFTTLRALAAARERIAAAFAREGLDYPLLVQGEGSKSELLMRFRTLGNAVLLGSASFWEGVDVPGNALSLVVIDKLPFAPPDDPLLAARLTKLRDEGGNPFIDWQLPQAAISLKQGAGRLIRTETDRGVLMICDPRLTDKPYGRRIWQSLPPMRRTRDEADAVDFFRMTEPVPETAVDAAG